MGGLQTEHLEQLEPIAYDGITDTDRDAEGDAQIVTDLNQLSEVLVATVSDILPDAITGNLLSNSNSGADNWAGNIDPGAATITSVTFNGVTHSFTSATDEVTFDVDAEGGNVVINGAGDYTWNPVNGSAHIDFTVQDGDGSTDTATLHLVATQNTIT
jgi:hypothetical protein